MVVKPDNKRRSTWTCKHTGRSESAGSRLQHSPYSQAVISRTSKAEAGERLFHETNARESEHSVFRAPQVEWRLIYLHFRTAWNAASQVFIRIRKITGWPSSNAGIFSMCAISRHGSIAHGSLSRKAALPSWEPGFSARNAITVLRRIASHESRGIP